MSEDPQEPGRIHREQVVHHTLFGASLSGADTLIAMGMDGQVTDVASTVNPGFPRAARALGVWLNSGTLGVNIAGNWTLALRLNRSGADSATLVWNPTTANDVAFGDWSTQVILNPTDQYHLVASGPSRVIIFVRAVLEFEII